MSRPVNAKHLSPPLLLATVINQLLGGECFMKLASSGPVSVPNAPPHDVPRLLGMATPLALISATGSHT